MKQQATPSRSCTMREKQLIEPMNIKQTIGNLKGICSKTRPAHNADRLFAIVNQLTFMANNKNYEEFR